MKQFTFESTHQQFWDRMDAIISKMENKQKLTREDRINFANDYRNLCYHLALAQSRTYSRSLVYYLQILVERGHRQFYRHRGQLLVKFWQFVRYDFPDTIKSQWRFVLSAHLLFYVPFLVFGLIGYFQPQIMADLFGVDPNQMKNEMIESYSQMDAAYKKGENRPIGDDWGMFSIYIFNNIGISFQMFGGGLVFGVGTLYSLLSNGIILGAAFGLMADSAVAKTFFSFVIAHGAFELTGIVLAGAAGMKLGWILIKPGSYSRTDALKRQGGPMIRIMCGAFMFLFIAAIIEGFWSPITALPHIVKFIVGTILWLLVYAYMLLLGKNNEA